MPEDAEPTGAGHAAGGLVNAVVGADGLLARIQLDARVMRFASQDLADHIVTAVQAAQRDQLERAREHTPPTEESLDLEEFNRRLDDMEAQSAADFARVTSSLNEMLRRLDEE